MNKFKGKAIEDIIEKLDRNSIGLEIAVENLVRDYNMGTIIRSANAFGIRHIHIIGSRQWNKRGAMMTDKYLHIHYYDSVKVFEDAMHSRDLTIFAIDNIEGSAPLSEQVLPNHVVMVFGAEGPGLSDEMLKASSRIIAIEQFGSTRSINVGVAAGIVMYEWTKIHTLSK